MERRGLSPIIATVLLISIALILAIIIFIWARSFVSEKLQKFNEPVEFACEKISFEAESTLIDEELSIDVVNRGEISLYGFEIRKKGFAGGSIEAVGIANEESGIRGSIRSGETGSTTIQFSGKEGDTIIIIPMIIGEMGNIRKAYACEDSYIEVEVV